MHFGSSGSSSLSCSRMIGKTIFDLPHIACAQSRACLSESLQDDLTFRNTSETRLHFTLLTISILYTTETQHSPPSLIKHHYHHNTVYIAKHNSTRLNLYMSEESQTLTRCTCAKSLSSLNRIQL